MLKVKERDIMSQAFVSALPFPTRNQKFTSSAYPAPYPALLRQARASATPPRPPQRRRRSSNTGRGPSGNHDHQSQSNSTGRRLRKSNDKDQLKFQDEDFNAPSASPIFDRKGFYGWRSEDDHAFRQLRAQEFSFRGPTEFESADLDSPPQPLGRDGLPSRYPAAVKYDFDTAQWVPTSAEEEDELRTARPIHDPYFVFPADYSPHDVESQPDRTADEGKQGVDHSYVEKDVVRTHYNNITSMRNEPLPLPPLTPEEQSRAASPDDYILRGFENANTKPSDDMSDLRRRPLALAPNAWRVVHLGTSSAIPTRQRNVSSTALLANLRGNNKQSKTDNDESNDDDNPALFLVDVGENTVRQLLRCEWCLTHGFRWIRAIFITHLHGDHIYGLPALLTAIGRFAQFRRRASLEKSPNDSDPTDPVIRIFGPYGTRGFVRASLHWTRPVGVRFAISELIPREDDFTHVTGMSSGANNFMSDEEQEHRTHEPIRVATCGSDDFTVANDHDVYRESPPPLDEEVRAEDVHVSSDGLWHLWTEDGPAGSLEVVAAPLKHRIPCFGYVFRETSTDAECVSDEDSSSSSPSEDSIDMDRARALGVRGRQYSVLRSGRSVKIAQTGAIVTPEDVRPLEVNQGPIRGVEGQQHTRKVTLLGDTCDSSAIADAAAGSDLLMHEATFTEREAAKARTAMHSTARMAGAFAREIRARKLVLTHFSSRYEAMLAAKGRDEGENAAKSGHKHKNEDENESDGEAWTMEDEEEVTDDGDVAPPNELVAEAHRGLSNMKYGGFENAEPVEIVAAVDFLEHDIPPRAEGSTDARDVTSQEDVHQMI